jgi:hypothetical protein
MPDVSRGSELWKQFKGAFLEQVRGLRPEELVAFWKISLADRTEFYRGRILPGLAEKLCLKFTREYLNVADTPEDQERIGELDCARFLRPTPNRSAPGE